MSGVRLAAWIIQDGNYREFRAGKKVEFALEFTTIGKVRPAQDEPLGVRHVKDSEYDVRARVVLVQEMSWVIDFGLLAYSDTVPETDAEVGSTVHAHIDLGVDPYNYVERHVKDDAWPDLVYAWELRAIGMQTAPFIVEGELTVRDPDKIAWRLLKRTNAWKDDDGDAEYLLTCFQDGRPPTRTSRTALH